MLLELLSGCEEQLQYAYCVRMLLHYVSAQGMREHKGNKLCVWAPGSDFLFSNRLHHGSLKIWFHIW